MDKLAIEILVDDIFSIEFRKTRNNMLIAAILSLSIVKGGLIPKSISALGITLTMANMNFLILLMILVCIFFLISFIFLVITDYIKWKMSFYVSIAKQYKNDGSILAEEIDGWINVPGHKEKIDKYMKIIKVNNISRLAFQILIPIIFSIYAVITLIMFIP